MTTKRTKRTTRTPRAAPETSWDDASGIGNDEGSDDVGLSMTGSGLLLLPLSLRKASPRVKDGAAHLQRLVGLRQKVLDEIETVIAEMRADGASWGVIAFSTGVTSDGARRRWGTNEQ